MTKYTDSNIWNQIHGFKKGFKYPDSNTRTPNMGTSETLLKNIFKCRTLFKQLLLILLSSMNMTTRCLTQFGDTHPMDNINWTLPSPSHKVNFFHWYFIYPGKISTYFLYLWWDNSKSSSIINYRNYPFEYPSSFTIANQVEVL